MPDPDLPTNCYLSRRIAIADFIIAVHVKKIKPLKANKRYLCFETKNERFLVDNIPGEIMYFSFVRYKMLYFPLIRKAFINCSYRNGYH